MSATAYLVGIINKQTLKLDGADIFSEDRPTLPIARYFPVTLWEVSANSYADARQRLIQWIESPEWDWIRPVMAKRP